MPEHCIGIIRQLLNFKASGALHQGMLSPAHKSAPARRLAALASGINTGTASADEATEKDMKSMRSMQNSIEQLSIPAAEEIIEEALNELAYSQDPGLVRALRFLAPPGYQAIVELCSESGRSKRRNALADTWSPEDDEVRIYFERITDGEVRGSRSPRAAVPRAAGEDDEPEETLLPADLDNRVKELCAALAEAERGGHAFIALKWFRDSFLPRKSYRWNQHPDSRQTVLAEAIQRGVVMTSKIANPKTPAYPTTTIRLNRAEAGVPEEVQRFHPVAVQGEAAVESLEEEREEA
jgi:hypothetical protein